MKFLLSLFSVIVLADSCNSKTNAMDAKLLDQNSIHGDYIVTQLGNKSLKTQTLKISFSKTNEVTGFGGCNSFFGTYTLEKGKISFGNIASSKKYCGKEIGTTERHFLSALSKSNEVKLIDGNLMFSSDDEILVKASKYSKEKVALSNPVIIYKAISRGSFDYIKISGTKVSVSTDRNLKSFSDYKCTEEDQEKLAELLSNLKLNDITQLEAPTDKRLFDGAPIATLTILKDKEKFTTPSFDHGHPPNEIKALVNKVLSIKENANKQ